MPFFRISSTAHDDTTCRARHAGEVFTHVKCMSSQQRHLSPGELMNTANTRMKLHAHLHASQIEADMTRPFKGLMQQAALGMHLHHLTT